MDDLSETRDRVRRLLQTIPPSGIGRELQERLHPTRFSAMSDKMAAIVGYILNTQLTEIQLVEVVITSDGMVLGRLMNDIGFNEFLGAESDLVENWKTLLDVAGLTPEQRQEAERRFHIAVRKL